MARLVRLTATDPLKIDPKTLPQDKMLAICQCGLSQNYPFCDGTHKTNGFKTTAIPGDTSAPDGPRA